MTSGIPGRAAPAPGTLNRSIPLVRISRAALVTNLRATLASTADAVIDVRADGWGHGAQTVARTALAAGSARFLVDEHAARALQGLVAPERLTFDGVPSSPYAVYGLSAGFRPVLSLHGRVLSLKRLRAGEGVSYGYTHRADSDTVVALVTGGYAQGVVRSLGNVAAVQLEGERLPIVGRVAMDVCVVDVGHGRSVRRGDEVAFFGDPTAGAPSISEWTAATGLTAAEIVTAVGLRNERVAAP